MPRPSAHLRRWVGSPLHALNRPRKAGASPRRRIRALTRGVVLDAVEVLGAWSLHQGSGCAPRPACPDLVQGGIAVGVGTWRRERASGAQRGCRRRGAPGDAGRSALSERGALDAASVPGKEPAPPRSARLAPTLGVQGQRSAVQEQLPGQRQAAVGFQQAVEQLGVHHTPQPRAGRECECALGVAARDRLGARVSGRENAWFGGCPSNPDLLGCPDRPELRSRDLNGEELRSARSCGSTRSFVRGQWRRQGAGPAAPPAPDLRSCPESAFSLPGEVQSSVAGMESVGLGWPNARSEDRSRRGYRAAKRRPARPRNALQPS